MLPAWRRRPGASLFLVLFGAIVLSVPAAGAPVAEIKEIKLLQCPQLGGGSSSASAAAGAGTADGGDGADAAAMLELEMEADESEDENGRRTAGSHRARGRRGLIQQPFMLQDGSRKLTLQVCECVCARAERGEKERARARERARDIEKGGGQCRQEET